MGQAAAVRARRPATVKATAAKQDGEAGTHAVAADPRRTASRPVTASRRSLGGFVCNHFNAEVVWKSMLESNDERIRLAAAKYLTDRLYGKAGQAVKISGEMDHKITVVVDL